MTDGQKRLQLANRIREGTTDLDALGWIVFWNLKNVDINQAQFKAYLTECGLNPKFALEHNYRSAFIRALRNLEEQRIIRRVDEDTNVIVYQFTAEKRTRQDAGLRLDYEYETRVVVDKNIYRESGDFEKALIEGDGEIRKALIALFSREKVRYRSPDVTRYIQRIFRTNADIVTLRDQGSVYFVPSVFRSTVDAVAKLVAALGGESTFDAIPMPNVSASRTLVKRAFSAEADSLIKDLLAEIQSALDGGLRPNDDNYDKWAQGKMKKVEEIRNRVGLYGDVLNGGGDKILKECADLETTILKPRILMV